MATVVRQHYVLASDGEAANRLALLVSTGRIPPMAASRAECVRLADLHPLGMHPRPHPYIVYTDDLQAWSKLISLPR